MHQNSCQAVFGAKKFLPPCRHCGLSPVDLGVYYSNIGFVESMPQLGYVHQSNTRA